MLRNSTGTCYALGNLSTLRELKGLNFRLWRERLHELLLSSSNCWIGGKASRTGSKQSQRCHPPDMALTGRSTSPGIFDVLTMLGREQSLGRLADLAKP
jgi:hypothetical protein